MTTSEPASVRCGTLPGGDMPAEADCRGNGTIPTIGAMESARCPDTW